MLDQNTFVRLARNPFLLARRAKRGRLQIVETNRLATLESADKKVRRARALVLRRQGKTYRAIGEIIGCGAESARIRVIQAARDERLRKV